MNLDPRAWGAIFPELIGPATPQGPRPILGFRINEIGSISRIDRLEPAIVSRQPGYCWEPGVNAAKCLRRRSVNPHQPPWLGCRCGFYAFHDVAPIQLPSALPAPSRIQIAWQPNLILAGVAAAGMVRIHRDGWRAQFVRVVALCDEVPTICSDRPGRMRTTDAATARALADRYQVPVVSQDDLRRVMLPFGDFVEEAK